MSPGSGYKSREREHSDSERSNQESSVDDITTHTNNPRLKSARIFVGNITHPRVTQSDLEEKFTKYGKILGISVHRGFAFVQFDRSSAADQAIKGEHLTMFKGVEIDVKTAVSDNMKPNGRNLYRSQRSTSPKHSRDRHSRESSRDVDDREYDRRMAGRDRSPLNRRNRDFGDQRESFKREGFPPEAPYGGFHEDRPALQPPYEEEQSRPPFRFPPEAPYGGFQGDRPALQPPYEEEQPLPPFRDDVLDPNRPNDCEIIVVVKHLRPYGESVERRLKNLGLTVDLLFLRDEAALLPTIDDIARKGSLFAIVVADQNETHRSVTLNILHGTPQEHRNMPLDDAMKLVAINYHEYVQTLRDKKMGRMQGANSSDRPSAVAATPASTTIPAANAHAPPGRNSKLQSLINLLSEGKYLTSAELGVLIDYLTQQQNEILAREHLQESSPRQAFPAPEANHAQTRELGSLPPAGDYGGQHQNAPVNWKYDNSGNSPAVSQVPAVAPVQEQQMTSSRSSNSFLNFDNPTVQRALDSLIQSGPNLLQKVLGSNDQSSDLNEKSQNQPQNYNQGSSAVNQDDHHQSMLRNPTPNTAHNQPMHDQFGSSTSSNTSQNYGNVPSQEDHFMQRQPQINQNQRQYPQSEGYNAPQHSDRSGGIRHPLLGTPVSNRFSSTGMGGRNLAQRPQKRDNYY